MARARARVLTSVLSLLAALVVVGPASATSANLGPVLGPLPSGATGGGPGTAGLNAAVSGACHSGVPVASPHWFVLPADLGTIVTDSSAIFAWLGRDPVGARTHTAVVDYATGQVVSCQRVTNAGSADHLALVVWLEPIDYATRAACAGPVLSCGEPEISVQVARTTGIVPANDRVSDAAVIPGLPFLASGDRTLADGDGPLLLPNDSGWLASQTGTVWYRYTAAATGRVPVASSGGSVGIGLVTANGVTRVDWSGGWMVSAGSTYLVSVSTPVSEYDDVLRMPPDGAFSLSLGSLDARDAPDVEASPGPSGAIEVRWTGASSAAAASGVTISFVITRGTSSTTVATAWGVGAQQRDLTGLVPGAEYGLWARLQDAHGYGATAHLTADAGPAPLEGESAGNVDVVVDATARTGRLVWSEAAGWPTPVTGYRVARDGTDANGAGPWSTTLPATARSFTFTHLATSTYRFTVTALTAEGARPDASVVARVLSAPTVPGSDLGLAYTYPSTGGTGQWTVLWQPPDSDGQSAITGYRLTRNGTDTTGAGPFRIDLPASARSFLLTKLRGDVDYTLTLQALNAVGPGPVQTVTTEQLAPTAPAPPTAVLAVAGDTSATVSWTPPVSWGSSAAKWYLVDVHPGVTDEVVASVTAPATVTSARVAPLVNGSSYSFTVRAVNQYRETVSARSNVVTPVKPPAPVVTVPGAPRIGVASGSLVSGKVRAVARWLPPVSDGGSAVLAYRVYAYRLTASGAVLSTTVSPRLMASYRAWTMLLPVGRYRFAVRAANAVGYSTYSARSNLVAPARVPTAPRIGVATSGLAGGPVTATARWYAPLSNGGAPITAYRVYAFRVTSTGVVVSYTYSPLLRATTRAYTMTLPRYGWYRFAVRAVNAMGYSPFSAKSLRIIGR